MPVNNDKVTDGFRIKQHMRLSFIKHLTRSYNSKALNLCVDMLSLLLALLSKIKSHLQILIGLFYSFFTIVWLAHL